jgi:hypothetical protein
MNRASQSRVIATHATIILTRKQESQALLQTSGLKTFDVSHRRSTRLLRHNMCAHVSLTSQSSLENSIINDGGDGPRASTDCSQKYRSIYDYRTSGLTGM